MSKFEIIDISRLNTYTIMRGMLEVMQFRKRKKLFGKSKNEHLQKTKKTKKEDLTSGCPQSFGYLATRPKNEPIPQQCLFCLKLVDCLYKK